MLRFVLLCALLFIPQTVLCQKFGFEGNNFLFTVEDAGDLLNGEILGTSLDDVLDKEMAKILQESGLTFGKDVIKFNVRVNDERVDRRKCLYESELRDAYVVGKIDITEELQFKANSSFVVHAETTLPLDLQLKGTLHTDVMAPLGFACPQIADVDMPITSDVIVEVQLKVIVFLNPTIFKKKGRTLLKVAPKIKVQEEVTNVVAASDVEYKVFDKVRVRFLEGLLEDIADEAIEKKGAKVLSRVARRLKRTVQKFVDDNLSGEEIDLGKTIDSAEASGALDDLVAFARLAFAAF